jgi:hypothetical protein
MIRNYRTIAKENPNLYRGSGGTAGNLLITNSLHLLPLSGSGLSEIEIPLPQKQYVKNALEIFVHYVAPMHPNISTYMSLTDISGTTINKQTIFVEREAISFGYTTGSYNVNRHNVDSNIFQTGLSQTKFTVDSTTKKVYHRQVWEYVGTDIQVNEIGVYADILVTEGNIAYNQFLLRRIVLPEAFTLGGNYQKVELRQIIGIR